MEKKDFKVIKVRSDKFPRRRGASHHLLLDSLLRVRHKPCRYPVGRDKEKHDGVHLLTLTLTSQEPVNEI